jgi:hypothetical protein
LSSFYSPILMSSIYIFLSFGLVEDGQAALAFAYTVRGFIFRLDRYLNTVKNIPLKNTTYALSSYPRR